MTTHTDTSEKGFQKLITKPLVEKCGYIETFSNEIDRDFCITKSSIFAFLKESQPVVYAFIIDEAHNSQSGTASASMNALFSGVDIPDIERNEYGEIDTEELV
ncbi:MAG: hypothetical protein U9N62_01575 [Thermotogota bacterium]|nr:hypothetical protein [Thermotogota bacterium]